MTDETPEDAMMNLRAAIRERARQKFAECPGGFAGVDVIEDMLATNRDLVVRGLGNHLVGEEIERLNDEDFIQAAMARKPDIPQEIFSILRDVSAQFGIPVQFLFGHLGKAQEVVSAAMTIWRVRAEAKQAELAAMEHEMDLIAPVTDGNPDMTMGEAWERLQRATDDTLRDLEDDNGQQTAH